MITVSAELFVPTPYLTLGTQDRQHACDGVAASYCNSQLSVNLGIYGNRSACLPLRFLLRLQQYMRSSLMAADSINKVLRCPGGTVRVAGNTAQHTLSNLHGGRGRQQHGLGGRYIHGHRTRLHIPCTTCISTASHLGCRSEYRSCVRGTVSSPEVAPPCFEYWNLLC